MKLTVKQEKFAQKYIELGNASEAYRASYSAKGMNIDSVNKEASRLLENPQIAPRIKELQNKHAEKHAVTVESLTRELEEARSMAIIEKQNSAAVSATMGKAKLHGLGSENMNVDGNVTVNLVKKIHSADN